MKIVIAPDSFKECLSAKQVAHHLKTGFLKVRPNITVFEVPMADGGEGTVEAMIDSLGGNLISAEVKDPLLRPINAHYGILKDGTTAIIEMASASGLDLLKDDEKNPMVTSTWGTGELILSALDHGCNTFIIGIGGSATNDGGAGMVQALGAKLINIDGDSIGQGGGALSDLSQIDTSTLDPRLQGAVVRVACDVNNPLTGKEGASHVYSPQKGGDPQMIETLDRNLKQYGEIIERNLGISVENLPGAGAAGGLGAGLVAFLNASLEPGIEIVVEMVDLEEKVKDADLVVTAEGKIDFQTQFGKTPYGVARIAKKYNVPVIAIAGSIGDGAEVLYTKGIDAIFSIVDKPMELKQAMKDAPQLLENVAERILRLYLLKDSM